MRSKKIFSFDEKKDAEEILINGFPNGLDYTKIYLIAKYFRDTYGYGEIKLERELIRFCKEQDKNFNPVVEAESIKKWIKSAMAYSLRKIDSVMVTFKEITFLKAIEVPKDRKILFMALVLSKALKKRSTKRVKTEFKVSDNYYIHYNNFPDIIRLCKTPKLTEVELAKILNKYKEHFGFYGAEKELIKLNYVDASASNGVYITDIETITEYYDNLFGKTLASCIVCGEEIIKNSNKQKYCKKCSAEKERANTKLRMRKLRENVTQ